MIRRICPICEQTMTSRFYCRHCHRFVRDSYLKEVNYYLNETHPPFEKDCEYHNSSYSNAEKTAGGITETKTTPKGSHQAVIPQSGSGSAASARTGMPTGKSDQYYRTREIGRGRNRGMGAFGTIVVFCVMMLMVGLPWLRNALSSFLYENTQVIEYHDWAVDPDESAWELEDAAVKAAGVNCNERLHFQSVYEEIETPVLDIIEKHGFTESERQHSSYNEEGNDGATWYGSDDYVFLMKDGKTDNNTPTPYIDFDYDTATGQMHGLYLGYFDTSNAIDLAIELSDYMREIEEVEGFSEGADAALVRSEMTADLAGDGYYYREDGALTISIDPSEAEGLYYVTMIPVETLDG